jgi:hypothetical protein
MLGHLQLPYLPLINQRTGIVMIEQRLEAFGTIENNKKCIGRQIEFPYVVAAGTFDGDCFNHDAVPQ